MPLDHVRVDGSHLSFHDQMKTRGGLLDARLLHEHHDVKFLHEHHDEEFLHGHHDVKCPYEHPNPQIDAPLFEMVAVEDPKGCELGLRQHGLESKSEELQLVQAHAALMARWPAAQRARWHWQWCWEGTATSGF